MRIIIGKIILFVMTLLFILFTGNIYPLHAQNLNSGDKWKLNEKRAEKYNYSFNNSLILPNLSQQQLHLTKQTKTFSAIIPDFKVNEYNDNAGWQYYSSIASDATGNFVITWEDGRNNLTDIYAQRYDNNGIPIGGNFRVSDDIGNIIQKRPTIAMNSGGDFVIAWVDSRTQMTDIYAQRFASDGSALGSNFKINDDVGNDPREYISIAIDSGGNFVITWHVYHNDRLDIYAQRFDNDGTPLGDNFFVSTGAAPAVAMSVSGNFVITWYNFSIMPIGIYAQRYTSNGIPNGNNFIVNDDGGISTYDDPGIAIDNAGNFVITWRDYRNIGSDIYSQRFTNDGSALGGNFKVNDDVGNEYQFYPAIALNGNGNFVITWADHRNGSNIYAQRYNSNGDLLGINFKVNDNIIAPDQFPPTSIATDSIGNFFITWVDDRNDGDRDIYAQRYASDGNTLGSNFKVNDDGNRSANQISPAIAVDDSGNFMISWGDYRHGEWDIYTQLITRNGNTLGSNLKVNNSVLNTNQNYPSIATDGINNYVVTWEDNRNSNWDIYVQYYTLIGGVVTDNFKVNDDLVNAEQISPAIAMNDSGNIVITWEDNRNGNWDIYAQRLTRSGSMVGSNFNVNDDGGTTSQIASSIAIDGSGNMVITWEDSRNGNIDIYTQRYDSIGNSLGNNFIVNDDAGNTSQIAPAIAMVENSNMVVTWEDVRNGNTDIYAQFYDGNGNSLGNNFKVNDDDGSTSKNSPTIDMDKNGNIVITWEDSRNGNSNIYAQRFSSNGAALGSNFMVTNTSNVNQLHPKVKLWNNRIYTTWQDNRTPDTGYDIWANILDWNNPVDIINNNHTQKPSAFILHQNYPNPFNPITNIEFTIPNTKFVTLKIYNLLGQEVATLVSDKLKAGSYQYTWDATVFSSGIYFYRLAIHSDKLETNSGLIQTRKLILLK